mgnify:CR=1 FL=1
MLQKLAMYSNPQRRTESETLELRREAGQWLRELRKNRGLSQRQLANAVGLEYYTFVSQLENGHGRLPPDKYVVWAEALGVEPRGFVRRLMSYYDPVTYSVLFDDDGERDQVDDRIGVVAAKKAPMRVANDS